MAFAPSRQHCILGAGAIAIAKEALRRRQNYFLPRRDFDGFALDRLARVVGFGSTAVDAGVSDIASDLPWPVASDLVSDFESALAGSTDFFSASAAFL